MVPSTAHALSRQTVGNRDAGGRDSDSPNRFRSSLSKAGGSAGAGKWIGSRPHPGRCRRARVGPSPTSPPPPESMRVYRNKKGLFTRDRQPKGGRPRAEATVGEDV